MHSTDMTRLAQTVSDMGCEVIALFEHAQEEGTYPSATLLVTQYDGTFGVTLGVLPTEEENHYGVPRVREAFCTSSTWAIRDKLRAMEIFTTECARREGVGAFG